MRFGVFDHLDDSGVPLGRHFEDRLKLIEAYDRAGFYGYHLAEHHNTPLGFAPSPGVFLSAVAGRAARYRSAWHLPLIPAEERDLGPSRAPLLLLLRCAPPCIRLG